MMALPNAFVRALAPAQKSHSEAKSGPTARLLAGSRGVFIILLVAFVVARIAGVTVPMHVQAAAYLGLMGSVSLLHGGFEHVANLKGRGNTFQIRYLLAYVVLIGVALGAYLIAPALGLLTALGVTVLKGGYGGLEVRRRIAGSPPLDGRWGRAIGAFVRGGAVMIVPYVLHPGVYSAVAVAMVDFFASDLGVLWAFTTPVRWTVGGWYAGLVVGYLGVCYWRGGAHWWDEAVEICLLVVYFAVVPPVVAVGVYFPFWYATRQVARMTAAGDGHPSLRAVAGRVVRDGALPWAGGLCLFVGLTLWLGQPVTPIGWIALYSVFVAAIALPHVVVGSWLDRRRGIWTVG